MSIGLRDELLNLKGKLESLEKELTDQMMELEVKADKWAKLDEEAENLVKVTKDIIYIDVGGKKFQTTLQTLLSIKDTLFYKLILSKKVDLKKELFIDRTYTYFHIILSFLRNKKVNLNGYTNKQLDTILEEANFYELTELAEVVEEMLKEIKFVSFTVNGEYKSGNKTAGTQNIDHLNNHEDRTLKNGICSTSPGWIIFELNREVDIEDIEIAGWGGNTGIWATSNGSNSTIYTSLDKQNWNNVGSTGGNYSNIVKIKLKRSRGKYVKVQGNSYLGIGYFRIFKMD